MAQAPRIITRREWGAAFQIPGDRHVPPSQRRQFIVHWPAAASIGDQAATVRGIERFHRVNQGWAAAPGYNYLVAGDQSGRIFEGCGRDIRGVHAGNWNTSAFGVCVLQAMGGPLTPEALRATRQLYDWLCRVAGRELTRSWHGNVMATACPGPLLTNWVRAGMISPGGPPPGPAPTDDLDVSCTGRNQAGILHRFRVFQGWVHYCWRRPGPEAWTPWTRFAPLPDPGATIISSGEPDSAGALNVFLDHRTDGRSWQTFQRQGENAWSGGRAGQSVAAFSQFHRIQG